jgi:catechol 2,3-dioxygenase-like lactoylglutathione lyase family enzyme
MEGLMTQPRLRVASVVLSSADPLELGAFYQRLLGYEVVGRYPARPGMPEGDGWMMLRSTDPAGVKLSFQFEPGYEPPIWPPAPGEPQMMLHLDIAAQDLEAAVEWALSVGATLAEHQPQERVRVMLDPAGHPFCLFPGPV